MFNKIAVIGAGYVGYSISLLLAQKNFVKVYDIDKEKLEKIERKISLIRDSFIEEFLSNKSLNLKPIDNFEEAIKDSNLIIICLPTDFDDNKNCFNTELIEKAVEDIAGINNTRTILIKSTVPIGFSDRLQTKYPKLQILYSPEFLREGSSLYDNIYPSRIVFGKSSKDAKEISKLFLSEIMNDAEVIFTENNSEAEAIKLFSNAYLAARVSFFNELDNYALINNLNSELIINGVTSDHRIGKGYSNPSFGYGGYCLPKDIKQLKSNFGKDNEKILSSVIKSNKLRKDFIAKHIASIKPKTIGIYKLTMKKDSDNFRESAIIDVIKNISIISDSKIIIYEPLINQSKFIGYDICDSFDKFISKSDLVIANRIDKSLEPFMDKVFTRDIYNEN